MMLTKPHYLCCWQKVCMLINQGELEIAKGTRIVSIKQKVDDLETYFVDSVI